MDASTNETATLDERLNELRSRISDLGSEVDADRAGVAAAMGAGVFLLLLAAGAAYDLFTGNAGVWAGLGIDRDKLLLIAVMLGAIGFVLVARAVARKRRGQTVHEKELDELEQKYADLLEQKKRLEGLTPTDKK